MIKLDQKLIVYDSNCKVCSSAKDVVLKLTSIPEEKIIAFKDLSGELTSRVDPEKFRNVMALIDTAGGQTIYGSEGVAHIFSSQYRIARFIFQFAFIRKMFDFCYKTQAYNRYIIAMPKSQFACDCFPDKVAKYRISYIAFTIVFSALLTVWLGISLKPFFQISSAEAATQMLLIAGSGWVLQILLACAILKQKALDYVGHLGSIMVVGLVVLIPWMLVHSLTGLATPYLPALNIAASSGIMLWLHIQRSRYLGLSQLWTATWFILLQSTAAYWIYTFHIK